jgi:hypothetical protein
MVWYFDTFICFRHSEVNTGAEKGGISEAQRNSLFALFARLMYDYALLYVTHMGSLSAAELFSLCTPGLKRCRKRGKAIRPLTQRAWGF